MRIQSANQDGMSLGLMGGNLFMDTPGPDWFVASITNSVKIKVQTATGSYDAVAHGWQAQTPTLEGVKHEGSDTGGMGFVDATGSVSSGLAVLPKMENPGFILLQTTAVPNNTLVYMRKRCLATFTYSITPTVVGSGSGASAPIVLYNASTLVFDVMTGTGTGSGGGVPTQVVTGIKCLDGVMTVLYGTV